MVRLPKAPARRTRKATARPAGTELVPVSNAALPVVATATIPAAPGALEVAYEPQADKELQLVQLSLSIGKNRFEGIVPLNARLLFGDIRVDGASRDYRMFVRTAHLQLDCVGIEAAEGTKLYRKMFGKETVKAKVGSVQDNKTMAKASAGFGAGVRAYVFKAKAAAEASVKYQASASETFTAHPDIALVQCLQNLRWRIGDAEYGDLRWRHRFLEGEYLSHAGDTDEPLCFITLGVSPTGEHMVTATVSVSLKQKQAVHIVPDNHYASDPAIAESERGGEFMRVLKLRLAALRLLSDNDDRDGFAIARYTLRAVPVEGGKP